MATAFRRTARGRISAETDQAERAMLRQMLDELGELLRPDDTVAEAEADADPLARELGLTDLARADCDAPTDPVVRRLLPDAYTGDEGAALEFRRFTDASLRRAKTTDAEVMLAGLARAESHSRGKVVLSAAEAVSWSRAMNDLRLALGTRLGVTADRYPDPEGMDPEDPRAFQAAVYDFLTWWQDGLVRILAAQC